MGSDPRVTVLMSVYNGEKYLREAVDSILAQTYRDFEFVIYDDCSSDGSAAILASYDDPRLVVRRNETNKGLTVNLADGVARARGEYVARMDADDIALSERLAKQVAWMDAHPEITILGSPVTYFNEVTGISGVCEQPTEDAEIKARLFINFSLMHPTILIRRADLVKNGLNYDPSYRCSQDHALYFDCILKGLKFANYPEPLLKMRSHAASISRAQNGKQRECSSRARVSFLSRLGLFDRYPTTAIETWHGITHGELPKTPEALRLFDDFIDDFCRQESVQKLFDSDVLRRAIANELKGTIYAHASERGSWRISLAFHQARLANFATPWPLKLKMKFVLKLAIGLIGLKQQ